MEESNAFSDSNLTSLEVKRDIITQKLQKRQEERLSEISKKENSSERENIKFFNENFNQLRSDIEVRLKNSDNVDKDDLITHFDNLTLSLQKLQKMVADSTLFLPSYEIRISQEVIAKFQENILVTRDLLLPKKKFGFKTRKKITDKENIPSSYVSEVKKQDVKIKLNDCGFKNIYSQQLSKTREEISKKDVTLSNLEDCIIDLYGAPSTLHASQLKNCKIFSGPISTSIFIDSCESCLFVVACQQLRIHSTVKTSFYVHITSRSIIEDCHEIYFAPYNWQYSSLNEDFNVAGLDLTRNNWNCVDDFNWLVKDKPSPNWKVLDENERVAEWTQ